MAHVVQPMPGVAPVTMLVVDDEPDVLESFVMLMESSLDVHAITATSGPEGLRMLARAPVDLIVSDYKMPDMDGCTFLEAAHKVAPGVPLVMVTAFPDAALEKRARRIPVRAFFSKSLDPDDLVEGIRGALESPSGRVAGGPSGLPALPRGPATASSERKDDLEQGAATWAWGFAADPAPVQLDDALGDVQSQARSWLGLV